jgi:phosphoribosylformylglycinamidine cyclo-ligase
MTKLALARVLRYFRATFLTGHFNWTFHSCGGFLVMSQNLNYKSAGVDIDAGDKLVDWLQNDLQDPKKSVKKMPHAERVLSGIGGFAALFDFHFPEMKHPVLVTCTDGVGTKVKLASQFERFETVGQDLVAMCVNDLICTGGKPLGFLDYYATGKLHLGWAQTFLKGVQQACVASDCNLIGGETAEMPGVYAPGDFDCAGFAIGVVDKEKTLGPQKVQEGDVVLGVSSSGFHSNGYSLLRKVFEKDLDKFIDQLLVPTHLYVNLVSELQKNVHLHALAHVTGGGIENIPRVLPEHLSWSAKKWELPPLFQEVQKRTQMSNKDMLRTLNCGIGFVVILPASEAEKAHQIISKEFSLYELGIIVARKNNQEFAGDFLDMN